MTDTRDLLQILILTLGKGGSLTPEDGVSDRVRIISQGVVSQLNELEGDKYRCISHLATIYARFNLVQLTEEEVSTMSTVDLQKWAANGIEELNDFGSLGKYQKIGSSLVAEALREEQGLSKDSSSDADYEKKK